ncbi:hypothetical protein CONPUDRAFT_84781 [Coniophora puteana RWD-64-598 SS2]|uniref:Uncharacterized protein n=1 Tax=Coniophora puteana (strain RWD-64-598) TaxID=741705 RepID=A0A5M3MCJ2_CONPW|nr:uncharacterized protein CONPUDRAFT_84781 [Coniophora puteana RWD-64-598 SS2]EIW76972.1 hypothetical protein CONPUDRAFT_84781 [Coniophora puteana RWD-64-598 SS2]
MHHASRPRAEGTAAPVIPWNEWGPVLATRQHVDEETYNSVNGLRLASLRRDFVNEGGRRVQQLVLKDLNAYEARHSRAQYGSRGGWKPLLSQEGGPTVEGRQVTIRVPRAPDGLPWDAVELGHDAIVLVQGDPDEGRDLTFGILTLEDPEPIERMIRSMISATLPGMSV